VAVLEALIVGLSILALTPLLSLWITDIWEDESAEPLVGAISVVRLAVAALLYWLRPRVTRWEAAGNF
jgi:hypothetical protein